MRLNRRILSAVAAILFASGVPQGAGAADDPATEPVKKLYAKVEETLKGGVGDLKSRVDAVGPTFAEVFDMPAMVKIAAGPRWKSIKPEQQDAVTDGFKNYFTTLYANRLSQAAGGKFEIKPGADARGDTKVVRSKATNKDGDDSEVDYIVNADNKIQDVLLNGNVSELAALRTQFTDPLKKGGADALLKFMSDRTQGMLAAKPKP